MAMNATTLIAWASLASDAEAERTAQQLYATHAMNGALGRQRAETDAECPAEFKPCNRGIAPCWSTK